MYMYIYMYMYMCVYVYVYIYIRMICKHQVQPTCCFGVCLSACALPGSWDGSETWRGETFGGGIGSCAKALHGAAFLELWASLGITGHHWATLSQYVEQYVTTHSQVKMLNTFEHLVAELSSDLDVMHLCTGCLGNYIVFQCLSCSQPALEALECPTSLTCFDIFRILPTLSVLVIYSRRAEEEARLAAQRSEDRGPGHLHPSILKASTHVLSSKNKMNKVVK